MVDFSLASEERDILASVKSFIAKEVMPYEEVLLRRGIEGVRKSALLTREEERELQTRARQSGLWGVNTPERFGGADLSPVLESLINLELGRTFVNFRFGGEVLNVLYHCNAEQQETYLTPTAEGDREMCVAISEPSGGSDVRSMRTTAVRDGDDFVINGEKMWITGGNEADFAVVFARTPGEGDPDGITGFLIDREMGWGSKNIPLMGAADSVAMLSFTDVRVPASNILGEVNKGFALLIDWVYSNRLLILAPKNVGTSERLLSMAIEWTTNRKTFGKALSERENVAFDVAECEIQIRAAKLMALNGAWKASVGQDYRQEAYAAKVYAARAANDVVDRVLQLHGGMGYAMEAPIERWYRDLRVERIYEGTDEINMAGIARNLFKGNVQPGQIF